MPERRSIEAASCMDTVARSRNHQRTAVQPEGDRSADETLRAQCPSRMKGLGIDPVWRDRRIDRRPDRTLQGPVDLRGAGGEILEESGEAPLVLILRIAI